VIIFHFKRHHQVMRMVEHNNQKNQRKQLRPDLNKRIMFNPVNNNRAQEEVYLDQLLVY